MTFVFLFFPSHGVSRRRRSKVAGQWQQTRTHHFSNSKDLTRCRLRSRISCVNLFIPYFFFPRFTSPPLSVFSTSSGHYPPRYQAREPSVDRGPSPSQNRGFWCLSFFLCPASGCCGRERWSLWSWWSSSPWRLQFNEKGRDAFVPSPWNNFWTYELRFIGIIYAGSRLIFVPLYCNQYPYFKSGRPTWNHQIHWCLGAWCHPLLSSFWNDTFCGGNRHFWDRIRV